MYGIYPPGNELDRRLRLPPSARIKNLGVAQVATVAHGTVDHEVDRSASGTTTIPVATVLRALRGRRKLAQPAKRIEKLKKVFPCRFPRTEMAFASSILLPLFQGTRRNVEAT